MNAPRPDIGPIPPRVAALPVSASGYPIPFFTLVVNGVPDFRVASRSKAAECIRRDVCWICGQTLGAHRTFVAGPLMVINRYSVEPPSHLDCAEFACRACPFLARPGADRRENNLPPGYVKAPGHTEQNPGVSVCWTTRKYRLVHSQEVPLFYLDEPTQVEWFREGRPATRDEAIEGLDRSMNSVREPTPEGRALILAEVDGYLPRSTK